MIDAPFALAFTAGLVATVNPCGFAMLPAYLSYFMGMEDASALTSGHATVRRALLVGAVVSSGFLLVFGVVGLLVTLGLRSIIDLIPWAAMVVGVGVGLLGIAMLAGFTPVVSLPKVGSARAGRHLSTVFTFGVSYAVASLSCTLPIFLVVVAGAIPRTSLVSGVLLFLVYGVGMSLVLVVLTLALALGKRGLVRWLRRSAAHVNRVSGAILVLASLVLGGVNGVNGVTAETNVGIGTTSPDRQLTVEGTQALGKFRRFSDAGPGFAPAFLSERARGTTTAPQDMRPEHAAAVIEASVHEALHALRADAAMLLGGHGADALSSRNSHARARLQRRLSVAGEMFMAAAKINLAHVPFKGAGASIVDVLGGHTDITFSVPGSVNHHIKAGTLIPLGVTGSRPSRALPAIPTFGSIGLGSVDPGTFRLGTAPAGLPAAIRNRLVAALRTAMDTPLVQSRLAEGGYEPAFIPYPDALGYIEKELGKWRQAVKDAATKRN